MSSLSPKHLILVGFRGVGKTTVGELLAEKLNCAFFDSDVVLVERENKTIVEIFSLYGEAYFRVKEMEVIQDLCQKTSPMVLSTGGGVVLSGDNRDRLKHSGTVVWLYANEDVIYERINEDPNRPPLTSKNLRDEIHDLLEHRNPLYDEVSDYRVDTGDQSPETIVEQIVRLCL